MTAKQQRWDWVSIAALNLAVAVMLGAFGAHALKTQLTPHLLSVYHTAVQYQFFHALGLLILGIGLRCGAVSARARVSAWLLQVGIVLFSGSLYLLAVSGIGWLGVITPFGGSALIIGWLWLAVTTVVTDTPQR